MQTKACTRCRQVLDIGEFNYKHRAKGTRRSHCRTCSRAYVRDHYARNTAYYIAKAMRRKPLDAVRLHRRVFDYLMEHPRVDCGEADPIVLDFDHGGAPKLANIGDMIRRRAGWRRILAEIEKCVVRCANCHRRQTAAQYGWYRLKRP